MTALSLAWPLVIALSAAAITLVNVADLHSPIRVIAALWFLLTCPGMAFVRLLRLADPLEEWAVAIALSLALDAAVAGAMVYLGTWSPDRGLVALVLLSGVGVAAQVQRTLPRSTRSSGAEA